MRGTGQTQGREGQVRDRTDTGEGGTGGTGERQDRYRYRGGRDR